MEDPIVGLRFDEQPELNSSLMVASWSGWADAASGASQATKALINGLRATKFASIDQQLFTVYTDHRPVIRGSEPQKRRIVWPGGDFYYRKDVAKAGGDLVIFCGAEPNLRWPDYCDIFAKIANICDVAGFATLGAMNSPVPHTRPTQVDKYAYNDSEEVGSAAKSHYQGPIFIGTAIGERFRAAKIPCVSYWTHNPHYLQSRHNPHLSLALSKSVCSLLSVKPEFTLLKKEGRSFDKDLQGVLEEEELKEYIDQLEEQYDEINKEDALLEVENLLRRHSGKG